MTCSCCSNEQQTCKAGFRGSVGAHQVAHPDGGGCGHSKGEADIDEGTEGQQNGVSIHLSLTCSRREQLLILLMLCADACVCCFGDFCTASQIQGMPYQVACRDLSNVNYDAQLMQAFLTNLSAACCPRACTMYDKYGQRS